MPHGNFLRGPIPEHPAPASRSGQDSFVSKGGPLVTPFDLSKKQLSSTFH